MVASKTNKKTTLLLSDMRKVVALKRLYCLLANTTTGDDNNVRGLSTTCYSCIAPEITPDLWRRDLLIVGKIDLYLYSANAFIHRSFVDMKGSHRGELGTISYLIDLR